MMTYTPTQPTFNDPIEKILKFIFPRAAELGHVKPGHYPEWRSNFLWDEYPHEWVDRSNADRSMPYLPSNLEEYVPSDVNFHEWPYLVARWVCMREIGFDNLGVRFLLPLIKTEIEQIIDSYSSILPELEHMDIRQVSITVDIEFLLLKVIYYFTPKEDIACCIKEVRRVGAYMRNIAGCLDTDGNVDREKAGLNALQRWVRKP